MQSFHDGGLPMTRPSLDFSVGGQLTKIMIYTIEPAIEEVLRRYSWGNLVEIQVRRVQAKESMILIILTALMLNLTPLQRSCKR